MKDTNNKRPQKQNQQAHKVLRNGRWSEQEAAIVIDCCKYRNGIDNLLVLLIGGIPIAMPTVLSVTMAIGSHRLSEQGVITKRMTAIEELAGMDVLCSDKTGTLTLN
ncbi:hypothetical protein Fmac_032501 [Flemingia macrophylla]|uniref:Plasma membrane H+-ATPase n=1 Tax=Flemingia macrophylla TaxID=520843 RepID=A0ABD1L536_9FABA